MSEFKRETLLGATHACQECGEPIVDQVTTIEFSLLRPSTMKQYMIAKAWFCSPNCAREFSDGVNACPTGSYDFVTATAMTSTTELRRAWLIS